MAGPQAFLTLKLQTQGCDGPYCVVFFAHFHAKTNLLGKQFPRSPKKLLGSIFSGEFALKYASVPPKPGHHNMEEKKDGAGAKKINRFHINDRKHFFGVVFLAGPLLTNSFGYFRCSMVGLLPCINLHCYLLIETTSASPV